MNKKKSVVGAFFRAQGRKLSAIWGRLASAIEDENADARTDAAIDLVVFVAVRSIIVMLPLLPIRLLGWSADYYLTAAFCFILWGVYKACTTEDAVIEEKPDKSVPSEAELEIIVEDAFNMQDTAMKFAFRLICSAAGSTCLIRPRDYRSVEVPSVDGYSFYVKGWNVIYQAKVYYEGELSPELEDDIHQKLQDNAFSYIEDYPSLIGKKVDKLGPVYILKVKDCGSFVLIDFVFTTEEAASLIQSARNARAKRRQLRKQSERYVDKEYGDE